MLITIFTAITAQNYRCMQNFNLVFGQIKLNNIKYKFNLITCQ